VGDTDGRQVGQYSARVGHCYDAWDTKWDTILVRWDTNAHQNGVPRHFSQRLASRGVSSRFLDAVWLKSQVKVEKADRGRFEVFARCGTPS
jgi:hypothetical protein